MYSINQRIRTEYPREKLILRKYILQKENNI